MVTCVAWRRAHLVKRAGRARDIPLASCSGVTVHGVRRKLPSWPFRHFATRVEPRPMTAAACA
jgi:hypothetical protein